MKFSRDKYAVLQGRWFEYVREVLGSKEVRKIVEDSGKDGDIVRSLVSCYSIWKVCGMLICSMSWEFREIGKQKCPRLGSIHVRQKVTFRC